MSYGKLKEFSVVIASGASTSSGFSLGGSPFARMYVQVGTMSTAAAISVHNSRDDGSSYFNVFHPAVNSTSVQAYPLVIASAVGANGGAMFLPVAGLSKLRFVASDVVSGGVSFNVVCSD